MLEDFHAEVCKRLKEKTENAFRSLVSAEASEKHDLIRGRYIGLTDAVTIVDEVLSEFSTKESVDLADVRDAAQAQVIGIKPRGSRYSRSHA